jgi:hypothetical protein
MANAGHAWWRRNVRKKEQRGNSTNGTEKGCKANSVDKFMAKRGRSYKHPDYVSYYLAKDRKEGRK